MLPKTKPSSLMLAAWLLTVAVVLITVGSLIFYQFRQDTLQRETISQKNGRADEIANRLEIYLVRAEQLANSTASLVAPIQQNAPQVETLLYRLLDSAPMETIYGIGVWFEPQAFDGQSRYYGPYVHRAEGEAESLVLTFEWMTPDYDYHRQAYYTVGKAAGGEVVFIEPYVDGDLIWMTASKAFFGQGGDAVTGVVSVDMVLPQLRDIIAEVNSEPAETIFVTSAQGAILAYPQAEQLLQQARQAGLTPDSTLDLTYDDWQRFHQEMRLVEVSQTISQAGWTIHIVTEERSLLRPVTALRNSLLGFVSLLWGLLGLLVLTFVRLNRQQSQAALEKAALETEVLTRKESEQLLQAMNDQLEAKVAARTAELAATNQQLKQDIQARQEAQEALQQARQAAEASNQAKSQFLAKMSHELRTPLHGILGYTQILQRRVSADETIIRDLKTIDECGQHLLTLITDILDFSQIERRVMVLQPVGVHLPSFVEGVARIVQPTATHKGLGLQTELHNLPEGILVDHKRLRQVLLNLLDNALKFTQGGHITLRVQGLAEQSQVAAVPSQPVDNNAPTPEQPLIPIRFEVADTGVGIAPHQLDKIFDLFEQIEQTGEQIDGVGLGLTISQHIIDLMGGTLQVVSTVNEGSRFWFELSLPQIDISEPDVVGDLTEPIIGYKGELQRILLISDADSANQPQMLIDWLELVGFDVVISTTHTLSAEKITLYYPNCILVTTPNRATRKKLANIRPTVTSPIPSIGLIDAATPYAPRIEGWADVTLTKPVDINALLNTIKDCVDLEWVYNEKKSQPLRTGAEDAITVPPPEQLNLWYDLAVVGDLFSIEAEAKQLAQSHPRFAPFVNRLNSLVNDMDTAGVIEFMQHYLKEDQ